MGSLSLVWKTSTKAQTTSWMYVTTDSGLETQLIYDRTDSKGVLSVCVCLCAGDRGSYLQHLYHKWAGAYLSCGHLSLFLSCSLLVFLHYHVTIKASEKR